MLQTILDCIEKDLIQESTKLNAAGHPVHKGTAREIFIQTLSTISTPKRRKK